MRKIQLRFAADAMLGKLAKWLRLMGIDTLYVRFCDLKGIKAILEDNRIFLTRNNGLYTQLRKEYGDDERIYLVEANIPAEQLKEISKKFEIALSNRFRLCSICNFPIKKVSRKAVQNKVPEYIFHTHEEFYFCPSCKRIYWSGSHLQNMRGKIAGILSDRESFSG